MNWNKIQKKHPKAWGRLISWQQGRFGFICRQLYDFFDEQEIYINILLWAGHGWSWDIRDDKFNILGQHTFCTIERNEAEGFAFEKAFEILEAKK